MSAVACTIKFTIVNDAFRVISEWRHNLEHHSELSITILELPFTLIYGVYSTDFTYDDRKLTIAICL
jgi:hypothetical protein